MIPALFFLRIALAIPGLLWFHTDFSFPLFSRGGAKLGVCGLSVVCRLGLVFLMCSLAACQCSALTLAAVGITRREPATEGGGVWMKCMENWWHPWAVGEGTLRGLWAGFLIHFAM